MRRMLATGLSCIVVATAMLPAETHAARPVPPTVTVEYHIDDEAQWFTPLMADTHRILAELFATYGVNVVQGAYLPLQGHVRVELLGDAAYLRSLPSDIVPLAKDLLGYASRSSRRALVQVGAFYAAMEKCPGGAVADAAEVAAHEIGHLFGLAHLETKELGSDIGNLMDDDGDLKWTRDDESLHLRPCIGPPGGIGSGDLDVTLTPWQAGILRDVARGAVLRTPSPDVASYRALQQRYVAKRTVLNKDVPE